MNIQVSDKSSTPFRDINSREPEWIYKLRRDGWTAYNDMPLPDRVVHLWRYSDPNQFLVSRPDELINIIPPHPDLSERNIVQLKPDISGYSYNRTDFMTLAFLEPKLAEQGVVFTDLYSAMRGNGSQGSKIAEHFGSLIDANFGKFEAMNLALWNTGLYLYIPDNVVIPKPIRLQRHPAGPFTFHRLLVVTGKNVQATIIDDYSGDCRKEESLINSMVEIFADESSIVNYANLQRQGENCRVYITERASIKRDAQFRSIFAGLGGSVSKVDAGTIMDGRGADSRIYGIAFGDSNQHFDYHTLHHHKANESYSNIDFKIVLKDKSDSAYTGLIKINEDALNCEAYQENRNLLLNSGAKAETIPELEILCDQVQCSHGATVGPVDPEMLFYLQSRGLSRDEAVRTVVSGFVEPTLSRLPEDLTGLLKETILTKLQGEQNG
jgi:Fe-S cluster assembly protein SufD